MIRMNGKCGGFTLIELLVVIAMIAIIMGALTTSVSGAQARARISKATSDVKVISQAILAYEKFNQKEELPTMTRAEAGADTLAFLIGQQGVSRAGDKIPALLMASFQSGGKLRDPWGHPYLVTIRKYENKVTFSAAGNELKTGYFLPNFYRVNSTERSLWTD